MNYKEEEYYYSWFKDNEDWLTMEWWNTIPPEDVPLDDDMPDYLEAHSDSFNDFCYERFKLDMED